MPKVNIDQGTDEWFFARCGRITASKFGDMFAAKSSQAYKKLVYGTAFQKMTGQIPPQIKSEWMRRGNELEPLAIEEYQRIMSDQGKPCVVSNGGFYTHGEFFGASPDGVIGFDEKGGTEAKCPSEHVITEYILNGILPDVYYWQVHGQIYVCEFDYVDFVCYHPALKKPMILRVNRDETICLELKMKMAEVEKDLKAAIAALKFYV